MNIKGKLVIIGGSVNAGEAVLKGTAKEDELELFYEQGILKKILDISKHGKDSVIQVVTAASQQPSEAAKPYLKAFELLGAKNCAHLPIHTREDAENTVNNTKLEAADIVFFTGGDQLLLTSTIGGTRFHNTLLRKYKESELVYAGTSAGAAAASSSMIYEGQSTDALLKGAVDLNSGLGLTDSLIADTHFMKRGRFGRLFQAVAGNPMKIGVGLSEDTGLIIENNNSMQVIGSGNVAILDGRAIADTNLTKISEEEPISISRVITHVLSKDDLFYLDKGRAVINKSQYSSKSN